MANKHEAAARIKENIIRLREGLNWNQAKLAQEADISGAALSMIEKGGRVPTIIVLRKLASALKAPVSDITGESVEEVSVSGERNKEFYRQWDVLDKLDQKDQEMLKGMAERLKKITRS